MDEAVRSGAWDANCVLSLTDGYDSSDNLAGFRQQLIPVTVEFRTSSLSSCWGEVRRRWFWRSGRGPDGMSAASLLPAGFTPGGGNR